MLTILTLLAAIGLGVLYALSSRLQAATLWAGRAIAPAGSEAIMPTGVQDALTPPWQTRLSLVWMFGFVGLLIGGSFQVWYLGVVALVVALATSSIVQAVVLKELATYLRVIAASLANREADYRRSGDAVRADAAHEFFFKVGLLLGKAAASKQSVPTMREARATPFGQLDDHAPR